MAGIDLVVSFDSSQFSPTDEIVDNPNLLSPPYRSKTWHCFSTVGKSSSAGLWEADVCAEKFTGTCDEFCHLIEGTVRLIDEAGAEKTFNAGDTFVIPKGFTGVWENVSKVRKVYVLF